MLFLRCGRDPRHTIEHRLLEWGLPFAVDFFEQEELPDFQKSTFRHHCSMLITSKATYLNN